MPLSARSGQWSNLIYKEAQPTVDFTCEMIDSSYQLSGHDAYQLNQVSGLI